MLSLSNVPTGKARFGRTALSSSPLSWCRWSIRLQSKRLSRWWCVAAHPGKPLAQRPICPTLQHATILMRKPRCGSVRTQEESEWRGQWVTALSDERKAVTEPSVPGTLGHDPSLLGCSPACLLPLRTCLSLGLSLLLVTACDHMQCDPSLWL